MRKRFFVEVIKSILGKKGVYHNFYDKNKIIYIHIPKTAGTSICHSIYNGDPWHFSSNELRIINPIKFYKYKRIAFVRDPLERTLSAYLYAKQHINTNPNTSLSFIDKCQSFDEFLELFLNEKLISDHYFFWKQVVYLNCGMGFIGKFENIQNDFVKMCCYLNDTFTLPHKNSTISVEEKFFVKKSNIKKVFLLYSEDYERFNYNKKISNKFFVIDKI